MIRTKIFILSGMLLCTLFALGNVQLSITQSKLCSKKSLLWENRIWWCEVDVCVSNHSQDSLSLLIPHQLDISPFFEERSIERITGNVDFVLIDSSKSEVVEAWGLRVLAESYYFDRKGRIHKVSYDCSNPDTRSSELYSQKIEIGYIDPRLSIIPPNESLKCKIYCLIGEVEPTTISKFHGIRLYWNISGKVLIGKQKLKNKHLPCIR